VVDADQLARAAVAPGEAALDAIVEAFGADVLGSDGGLDRAALAARVFGNDAERARLNAIVHPRVRALAQERFDALERAGEPLACYEVPLLVETGQADRFRPLVVVSCEPSAQRERLMERDGSSAEHALARIASQLPVSEKVALADFVIENDSSVETALARADRVLGEVCRELAVDPRRYGLDPGASPGA